MPNTIKKLVTPFIWADMLVCLDKIDNSPNKIVNVIDVLDGGVDRQAVDLLLDNGYISMCNISGNLSRKLGAPTDLSVTFRYAVGG